MQFKPFCCNTKLLSNILVTVLSLLFCLTIIFVGTSCSKQDAKQGKLIPVIGITITGSPLQNTITVVGNLQANEDVVIKSEIGGIVDNIDFEEGQTVQKGTVLIQVDHKNLAAEMEQARANFNLAAANLKRSQDLVKNKTISTQAYDQALAQYKATNAALNKATQQYEKASIIAPFDGIMGARNVSPGQFVGNNDILTSISSVNPIKLEFNLAERYLSKIHINQKVEVTTSAYPDKIFIGETFFIAPTVDIKNRTILIKAKIDNSDLLLKPGMFSRIRLILEEKEDAILIPNSAVVNREHGTAVFTVTPDGTANYQDVTLGIQVKDLVEVTSGLKTGDTIVTEWHVKIQPGMKVKVSLPA